MNLKTDLTKKEREEYREALNLTEDQERVYDLLTRGKSILEISLAAGMSETSVSRRLKEIRRKFDRVLAQH